MFIPFANFPIHKKHRKILIIGGERQCVYGRESKLSFSHLTTITAFPPGADIRHLYCPVCLLHLEDWCVAKSLSSEHESNAKHGSASIGHLSGWSEGTESLLLGSLQDWDQTGDDEEEESTEDEGLGAFRNLLGDSFLGSKLSTHGGQEAKHGQPSVDDLGGRTREGHGFTDGWGGWGWGACWWCWWHSGSSR